MKPVHLIPLGLFLIISTALGVGLTLNPAVIPSAVIGKPLPEFDLKPLYTGGELVAKADFKKGDVKLINIFASWCIPCRIEHPLLMALKARGVLIYGLNYKDSEDDGRKFLEELGNPFHEIGIDKHGRVGIDLGISGVPETFVVSGDGVVLFQHNNGPLTREVIEKSILPLLEGPGR